MESRTKDFTGQAKDIAREAQETVKETASQFSDKARQLSSNAKEAVQNAYGTAQQKVKVGAQATDEAIRQNPYAALGIAFGAGLLIGFLVTRK